MNFRMTAFIWTPNKFCAVTFLSPDSYIDYDPRSTAQKIYVNLKLQNCEYFYIAMIELKLSRINQVYYSRSIYKSHKHYNYLQSIFNQKLFTEDIENAK
jgi:hypothetical protein